MAGDAPLIRQYADGFEAVIIHQEGRVRRVQSDKRNGVLVDAGDLIGAIGPDYVLNFLARDLGQMSLKLRPRDLSGFGIIIDVGQNDHRRINQFGRISRGVGQEAALGVGETRVEDFVSGLNQPVAADVGFFGLERQFTSGQGPPCKIRDVGDCAQNTDDHYRHGPGLKSAGSAVWGKRRALRAGGFCHESVSFRPSVGTFPGR